jgi:hypothetical protein
MGRCGSDLKVEGLREISITHDALRAFAEIEEPLEIIEEPGSHSSARIRAQTSAFLGTLPHRQAAKNCHQRVTVVQCLGGMRLSAGCSLELAARRRQTAALE